LIYNRWILKTNKIMLRNKLTKYRIIFIQKTVKINSSKRNRK